ncbi:MAG: phosphatase [Candidatus Pacebacteria bacterium]|nr:phosphatase [Candidatus Paceibacterota bacterium]
MARIAKKTITHFIFDVDGVFTTGQFLYTSAGKFAKVFGAHDADGIKLMRPHAELVAISADKRGFAITKKRIESDMGIPLHQVSEGDRLTWLEKKFDLDACIYMGDGMHDAPILARAAYGIAPANAFPSAKKAADYVTEAKSGEGAVAEACLHVINTFFKK